MPQSITICGLLAPPLSSCLIASAAPRPIPGTDPQQLAHALLAQYQGIILLAKLNDSGVAHLAPALHAFVDGYLTDPKVAAQ